MVIGRDAALRARIARLATRAGFRVEVAESLAYARRAGLDDFAFAIVVPKGLDGPVSAVVEEVRASVERVLVVAPGGGPLAGFDVIDPTDEPRLLSCLAETNAARREPEPADCAQEFAGFRLDVPTAAS